ncbi:MAG TPA: DNA topoisomerase 4 subunit A [Christensenellaceae bacterium]|nr:DNA topoisomerase 4 subunit A [Christensenellaceae bacterium]
MTDIEKNEDIIIAPLEEVLHNSMMPYAEYVIMERALPRVEDGLKPVQRRILYTMQELGITPDKPHRKCARIVGDCLGKYHPHGDSSVYDALVRLAQPFSLRNTLVDGHGNFGSIDGDSAAAMRYTEARMTPLALEMLRDLNKDTVPFRLNFDDTLKEPDLLPSRFPNVLVNGASGIAVGLATNIPTHNLRETINACIYYMENPTATLDEIMEILPAPDFPTGGQLLDTPEIREAYETGRGKLTLRAKVHVEKGRAGRHLLCITEIPYQVNKAQMLEKILKLSSEKKAALGSIYDIRDESDRTGLRAVVELKKDADPLLVLGYLYKYSDLQVTFGVNMVMIAEGKPQQLGLIEVIEHYIAHQKNVVTKRTQFDLEQAKSRAHILEGLIRAVDNLDEVIALIRSSKNGKEAKERLIERFAFTAVQAQAILDLRLQRLTGLEILELRKEYEQILVKIKELELILKSERKLISVIKKEMKAIADEFGDDRRTEIVKENKKLKAQVELDEIPVPEQTVVIITYNWQLRRMLPKAFEKIASPENAQELVRYTFRAMTDEYLYIFTNMGNCFRLLVEQIEESNKPKDRGISIGGLIAGLDEGEIPVSIFCTPAEDIEHMPDLLFFTKKGYIKRSIAKEYDINRSKFIAIKLGKGDELISVSNMQDDKDVIVLTRKAMLIRFPQDEVPSTGRATRGVAAIKLNTEDSLCFGAMFGEGDELILVSERGYAKRIMSSFIDVQHRAGKGSRAFAFYKNASNGSYIAAQGVISSQSIVTLLQTQDNMTPISSDEIAYQALPDRGRNITMALMDNVVCDMFIEGN